MKINRNMLGAGLAAALGFVPVAAMAGSEQLWEVAPNGCPGGRPCGLSGTGIWETTPGKWEALSPVIYSGDVWDYEYACGNKTICTVGGIVVDPGRGGISVAFGKTDASGTSHVNLRYAIAGKSNGTMSFDWPGKSRSFSFQRDGRQVKLEFGNNMANTGNGFSGLWITIDDTSFYATPDTASSAEWPGQEPDAEVPPAWQKARTLTGGVWDGAGNLVGAISVRCGKADKKGFAKISATLTGVDGRRKSMPAQSVNVISGVAGFEWPAVGIANASIVGGSFVCSGEGVTGGSAGVGGLVFGNASFPFSYLPHQIDGFAVDYPGAAEPFRMDGKKWVFAKPASLKWRTPECVNGVCTTDWPGRWEVNTADGRTNVSGLRLNYSSRTGAFSGGFTAYLRAPGGKKTKISVKGLVVDGVAYAVALFKKPDMRINFTF